jgi:hypothetical protein
MTIGVRFHGPDIMRVIAGTDFDVNPFDPTVLFTADYSAVLALEFTITDYTAAGGYGTTGLIGYGRTFSMPPTIIGIAYNPNGSIQGSHYYQYETWAKISSSTYGYRTTSCEYFFVHAGVDQFRYYYNPPSGSGATLKFWALED